MNPVDLFNQVKELIATKDFDGAKQFIEEKRTNSVNTWNRQKACYQVLKVLTVF